MVEGAGMVLAGLQMEWKRGIEEFLVFV